MKTALVLFALIVAALPSFAQKELPPSVRAVFFIVDDLAKADTRPAGISAVGNVERIKPIMEEIMKIGEKIDRQQLNRLYQGLGDHLLDDAVPHAKFTIEFIQGNRESFERSIAAILRWKTWWRDNREKAMDVIMNKY